ncbi:MAG: hypothetical protein JW986_01595 [Methanotrichaceae archaeon]|nr:hypothetical protein [Methanotrichaceae archaeon]
MSPIDSSVMLADRDGLHITVLDGPEGESSLVRSRAGIEDPDPPEGREIVDLAAVATAALSLGGSFSVPGTQGSSRPGRRW